MAESDADDLAPRNTSGEDRAAAPGARKAARDDAPADPDAGRDEGAAEPREAAVEDRTHPDAETGRGNAATGVGDPETGDADLSAGGAGPVDSTGGAGPADSTGGVGAADEEEPADHADGGADHKSEGGGEEAAPVPPVRRRRRRVVRWIAVAAAMVLLAAGGTAVGLYAKLRGNIHREHVAERLGPNRPAKLNTSMNILLLGSDSRAGANRQYWSPDISGERSDTTILLHLSPNRDRAVAVSFPRDSMVAVPACEKKDGGQVPAFFGMLNAAFAYAGPTCTWKMIESTTNIHVDHYVKIDFAGFKRVVDALGGVEICLPRAVNDPRADLYLPAGRQVVKGNDALGYVRTRYGLGDGSDLERIQRQQRFMAAVVKKATSQAMLTEPSRAYRFLDAVTKSIATDDAFSLSAMRRLATSLKGMSAGTVRFVTVPTRTYPKDPNRVEWDMAQAAPLFEAIRKDDALPAPRPVAVQPAPPRPGEVKVTVVNAPDTALTALRAQGFQVTATRRPARPATRILYGAGAERYADALAVAVPGVVIAADRTVAPNAVSLVVGPEGVQVRAPDPPKVDGEINGAQNPCAA